MPDTTHTSSNDSLLADDAPVLVAVLAHPDDLVRARDQHWYRIPLSAPTRQLAADYVAFYQTGTFGPAERWAIRYYAPVRGYHITTRRELIPGEPDHPHAADRYYRVELGPLQTLPSAIPSRRLRRITFIHTTLDRLLQAHEINDLWLKTKTQQRLWEALQQAQAEAEIEYPLVDDLPYTADFALFCQDARIAVIVTDDRARAHGVEEPINLDYLLARGRWHTVRIPAAELERDAAGWAKRLATLACQHGGFSPPDAAPG